MSEQQTMAPLPLLSIDTQALIAEVERLLQIARGMASSFGAVNWGDLGVADVEYRLSVMHPSDGPSCVVLIEEAAPECGLPSWLHDRLDHERFPGVRFECEW